MTGHARLSPSNHRWVHCPGSVREESRYPDVAGDAAIDGTGTHLLLELCLESGDSADAYDGQIIGVNHPDKPSGWSVSTDRIKRVNDCLAYIDRRVQEISDSFPGAEINVESESKSNPGQLCGRSDWYGTCDVTITATGDNGTMLFLEIVDYKDGRGFVSAVDNSQLISYAGGKMAGRWMPGYPNAIRTTVVQPKTTPCVRSHDYTTATIMAQLDRLTAAAAATDEPDAPLVPGQHCQWCKHKPHCTAAVEKSMESLTMFDDIPTADGSLFESLADLAADVTTLESAKLAELLDAQPALDAAFARIAEELQTRIECARPDAMTVGYAMLPGRKSREWNEEEEQVAKMLRSRGFKRDDIYPPKLVSVAQVMKSEKLTDSQKETIEKKFVEEKPGKMKLTKVRQKQNDVVQMFDDVAPSFF